jgi:hypothetical protein
MRDPVPVHVGPYIYHFDKTHVDQLGNHVLAPLYMSLGNYDRTFAGRAWLGYVLVAILISPKPDSYVARWKKDSPGYRWETVLEVSCAEANPFC